jgi:predicted DNA binding CopG/RHH family protein
LKEKNLKKIRPLSPEEVVDFLESIRQLEEDKDEPTQSISLRVPSNILRSLKLKAKSNGQKYQSLIIQVLRQSLKNK